MVLSQRRGSYNDVSSSFLAGFMTSFPPDFDEGSGVVRSIANSRATKSISNAGSDTPVTPQADMPDMSILVGGPERTTFVSAG